MSAETPDPLPNPPDLIVLGEQPAKVKFGPWTVEMSPGQQYLYIEHSEHPGDIHVKADVAGYAVDVWDNNKDAPEIKATLAVEYVDLQTEEPPALAPDRFLVIQLPGDCGEEMGELAASLAKMLSDAQVRITEVHVDNELNPELLQSLRMQL